MRVCCTPLMKNFKKSLFVSEETFHQKSTVPGPFTIVVAVTATPSPMGPLCAASEPSRETTDWPNHSGVPIVLQSSEPPVSKASAREIAGLLVDQCGY